jgi:hypothetical protein
MNFRYLVGQSVMSRSRFHLAIFAKHCFRIVLLLLLAILAGCGQDGPQIAPVHGRVTLDGQPLALADVSFQPEGAKRPSSGRTDSDGRYELMYKRGQPGALVGEHTVRISVSRENVPNPPIIAKEFDTETKLRREVKSGDNEFNFDVTTEKK